MKHYLFSAALVLGLSGGASAAIIQADLSQSLDLPDFLSLGPRVLTNTGVAFPSAGPHLDASDEISNPSIWLNMLEATFDNSTNIVSLAADAAITYQTIVFTMTGLLFNDGAQVIGVVPIVTDQAVTGSYTIGTSFTANSITITYTATGLGSSGTFAIATSADQFEIQLDSPVPEPASVVLTGAGLLGLLVFRRKRR